MSHFGAIILDATGHRLTAEEKVFFQTVKPFGFILFAHNVDTPDQVRALCDEMRSAAGHDAPILIDQEGGRVQRLRPPWWRQWAPPAEEIARAGEHAAEAMYLRSRIMADELLRVGIDTNCAPLVDLICADTHDFLRDRCYGTNPVEVAKIGRAVADGLMAGGGLPVVKHMPGHGRAKVDSHFALPKTDAPSNTLQETDFAPFKALSDLPMGMTGHVVFSALDDKPATTSPIVMQAIRDHIGFDGLIMTDDIAMKALDGEPARSARAALDAGCDVVLHCNGTLEERRAVADAAGRMTDQAQIRAERALAARKAPGTVDIPALEARLEALTQER